MSSISGKGMIDNQSNQIYFHDHLLTDEKWKAIIENDAALNNQFLNTVITTKIFCNPSCILRLPKKENVCIFFALNKHCLKIFALVNVVTQLMNSNLKMN